MSDTHHLPVELQDKYALMRKTMSQRDCARALGVGVATLVKLDRGGYAQQDAVERVTAVLRSK